MLRRKLEEPMTDTYEILALKYASEESSRRRTFSGRETRTVRSR